jgi:hypothetical protein
LVVLLLATGLAVTLWVRDDGTTTATGPTTTVDDSVIGPRDPQLPPVGDDPVVSCDPWRDQWYRRSALDGPTGVENETDPAATALRNHLAFMQVLTEGVPPLTPVPANTWRRLAATDTKVLFGAGEFAGEMPLLGFQEFELVDGTWQNVGSNSGTCNELWVQPPHGLSIAQWHLGEGERLEPDATELRVAINVAVPICAQPPLRLDELVGPDVVETDETVTIRVATRRPLRAPDNDPDCLSEAGRDGMPDMRPVEVTVALRSPLGDRQVLDGNLFPARDVEPTPVEREEDQIPEPPRLDLPGGTVETRIMVRVNDENVCDPQDMRTCTISVHEATLSITASGETLAIATNERGEATVVVPEGEVEVSTEADDLWCPRTVFSTETDPGMHAINCTRVDLPHTTISGVASSERAGVPEYLVFQRAEHTSRTVTVLVNVDGRFETILEPGTWFVSGAGPGASHSACRTGDMPPFTVEDGVPLTVSLGCP